MAAVSTKLRRPLIFLLEIETRLLDVLMEDTLDILDTDAGDDDLTVLAGVEMAEETALLGECVAEYEAIEGEDVRTSPVECLSLAEDGNCRAEAEEEQRIERVMGRELYKRFV